MLSARRLLSLVANSSSYLQTIIVNANLLNVTNRWLEIAEVPQEKSHECRVECRDEEDRLVVQRVECASEGRVFKVYAEVEKLQITLVSRPNEVWLVTIYLFELILKLIHHPFDLVGLMCDQLAQA